VNPRYRAETAFVEGVEFDRKTRSFAAVELTYVVISRRTKELELLAKNLPTTRSGKTGPHSGPDVNFLGCGVSRKYLDT